MDRMNCWQYKRCGREPGGSNSKEHGVCMASIEIGADGINGGKAAGRSCWAVAGSMCGAAAKGTFAQGDAGCEKCEFYHFVRQEEGDDFQSPKAFWE